MAKKISQLTQATEVKSDDVTVIVQDGETKKLPLNMMVTKQDIENKKVAGLAKLDEIEATYENDTYTPTITVKNKSSVKTGEGDEVDYSANVMDGPAKSAILKGNTLVNISNINKFSLSRNERLSTKNKVQVGKTYLQVIAITKNTLSPANDKGNVASINDSDGVNNFANDYYRVAINETGILKKVYTVTSTSGKNDTSLRTYSITTEGVLEGYEMLIEYQEGMENWDIPYFDGMQSVKMPVLTTTGKNLFDFKNAQWLKGGNFNSTYGNSDNIVIENMSLKLSNPSSCVGTIVNGLKPNTEYYVTAKVTNTSSMIINGWLSYGVNNTTTINGCINGKLTTNSKGELAISIGVYRENTNDGYVLVENIQLEEGSTSTPYEPFKSNILTVNEEVELRGIGDVKDTLDGNTGELTQRIGEIVLDGSEDWKKDAGNSTEQSSMFFTHLDNTKTGIGSCISDIMPSLNGFHPEHGTDGVFIDSVSDIDIRISNSKLNSNDVDGFKQWLSQNPITVQYKLATPIVKTVDLIPSGTHPSTTPYCWKGGHIQLSSSGLLPNLEYSVVTSRAGQINQNATMIVKNDKRIFDLEILLAGGLVNTTYQALTLQNQVETGLSKVSLSSETEPDYLLYHMIMKLIEEKAYKLDDLTEKVSVFYLYEKLSDEQFETIYSELYPFVEEEYIELPEDGEIIEEPIVDEVLEEVENEVVM